MRVIFLCLGVSALLTSGAYAQALVEHAVAAAGAVAGTAGGKGLSFMLDKTLEQAAKTAEVPAAPPPSGKVVKAAATGAIESIPAHSRARASGRASREKPVFASSADRSVPLRLSGPVAPSSEDFAKVREGGSRQDVLTALGIPSSHVTIPDEGHLIEIMSYQNRGRSIGSIRLDNGHVVSVTTFDR